MEKYLVGIDPAAKGKNRSSTFVYKTLGEVVATYRSRPARDIMVDIGQMAGYYGASIMKEDEELIVTEDAEIISIETASKCLNPGAI